MITHYTEEELKGRKHLFVSYSHDDATVVQETVEYLIGEGVQLWYDRDLHVGDNWRERVKGVLAGENCIGVIFFNSKSSFSSEAIDFEREIVIGEKAKKGDNFRIFTVHIGKPSTMQLIKQVLESLPDDSKAIEAVMDTKQLSRIVELFEKDLTYSYVDNNFPKGYLPPLYDAINTKETKAVIDRSCVMLDSVHDIIAEKDKEKDNTKITIKLGSWQEAPLIWRFFRCDGDDWVFLLDSILCKRNGGAELLDWLNGEFKDSAFNPSEKAKLAQSLRLLSMEEIEKTEFGYLIQSDQSDHWWISDTNGTRQATVRPDGTIYQKGFYYKNVEKDVRPVIVIDGEKVQDLIMNS